MRALGKCLMALVLAGGLSHPALAMQNFNQVKAAWHPSDSWLLARDGQVLEQLRIDHDVRRLQWTKLEDVSPALLQALIYSEDKRFYEHAGVDWQAVAAASWRNLWNTRTRGASTLTMQLAGLLDNTSRPGHRSIGDKIGQSASALWLEKSWRKDEILEAYLNQVTFRGELQGVAAMSYGLFNKAPAALDSREAALAAVLLRSPNAKAPVVAARACSLLKQMQQSTYCEDIEGYAVLKLQGPFDIAMINDAPHLARRLISQSGVSTRSTLDAGLQRYTNQQLRENLLHLADRNVEDGAVLVLDNMTGQVLAWVGSSGSLSQAANVDSVLSQRQAGSTLKPFLYGVAVERRALTMASILDDSPVRIATPGGLYVPQNYDKHFVGPVSARVALASSLNVPAVRTLLRIGQDTFHERLQSLGFTTLDQSPDYYGYSLALGAADVRLLDLTNAYRALANGGLWSNVSERLDVKPAVAQRVFSQQAAYMVADVLSDRNARYQTFGIDSLLATSYWTAVKTGTSKDMRDNWCIGFSRRYTVGVWVGNASGESMHDVSGISGAAPVWLAVMDYLHRNGQGLKLRSDPPPLPQGLKVRNIRYEPAIEPARREVFLSGMAQDVIIANAETVQRLSGNTSSTATSLTRISYPGEGTIIALDPEIPPARQGVVFRASGGIGKGWQWQIDGKQQFVSTKIKAYAWFPMPGHHTLNLLDEHSKLVDSVHFEVRGAQLKTAGRP